MADQGIPVSLSFEAQCRDLCLGYSIHGESQIDSVCQMAQIIDKARCGAHEGVLSCFRVLVP